MSNSDAKEAVLIAQQALGRCVFLEQEVREIREETNELRKAVDRLEGDLDE
ncbi:hypothetical protein [Natrarchaeobaculum sulfurireducens]|uniref:hypothetical protein n=1 Tax=Natrarchaeobaculum sulfurireducens TaxID=2044521 RepID=UPI0012B545B7|nr:hypothetical protein [Natrarchaeobaculum sulfurireducens]